MEATRLQLGSMSLCTRETWPCWLHFKGACRKQTATQGYYRSRKHSVISAEQQNAVSRNTKLVTFLGKGGSGKTIASLLSAHHYASIGLRTCLVVQSQEPTVDYLLGGKVASSPISFCDGALDVVRLETTKLLLDPLAQLKKADAQLNFSQGALDEVLNAGIMIVNYMKRLWFFIFMPFCFCAKMHLTVYVVVMDTQVVGEELSVLPGMDALLALGAMEQRIGFAVDFLKGQKADKSYDVVVYDGLSSEETLRLLGAAEKSRWYLQRARDLAEKTDTGRVTSPTILRLLETSVMQGSSGDNSGRTITELWDGADKVLERISQTFMDSRRFSCFLVMDPSSHLSVNAALRYWGCAAQAGLQVKGAFYAEIFASDQQTQAQAEKFSPLLVSSLPSVPIDMGTDWSLAISNLSTSAKVLLQKDTCNDIPLPVEYNAKAKTVNFFLPGFEKSEIRLSQWRGGSALLIEVGDQRRVVQLPLSMRGKVSGAKFEGKTLVVTMKP